MLRSSQNQVVCSLSPPVHLCTARAESCLFECEQSPFDFEICSKAAQRSVRADDAVARDEKGEWIAAARIANRPSAVGLTATLRQFLVRDRVAKSYGRDRLQNGLLKHSSRKQRERFRSLFTIGLQPLEKKGVGACALKRGTESQGGGGDRVPLHQDVNCDVGPLIEAHARGIQRGSARDFRDFCIFLH